MSAANPSFSLFDAFNLPTMGSVDSFAVGDFDGDGVGDLAFADTLAQSNDSQSLSSTGNVSLSIIFGSTKGPTAPISMDRLGSIAQIQSLNAYAASPDDITDLYVNWQTSSALDLALFLGSSDRQLLAPDYLAGAKDQDGGIIYDPTNATGTPQPDRYDVPIGAAIGTFVSGPSTTTQADLAVPSTFNLWIMPMKVGAQLADPADTLPTPFAKPVDLQMFFADGPQNAITRPVITRVRPSQANTDAVTLVSAPATSAVSQLSLAAADANGIWGLSSPQPIPNFVLRRLNDELFPGHGGALAADVDGDGSEDLVLFSGVSGIRVILNSELAQLASDPSYLLDETKELSLPVAELAAPQCPAGDAGIAMDVAAINLDTDPGLELVVVQNCLSSVVKFVRDTTTGLGHLQVLPATPASQLLAGTSIAVGDVNGDGLPDVVIGHGDATSPKGGSPQVFLAVPRPPGPLTAAQDAGAQ
jgi:hypothetical protein